MTDTFDPTKPVQTRDGREVVIYTTNAPGAYPIHGRINYANSGSLAASWTIRGQFRTSLENFPGDLVNIPEC